MLLTHIRREGSGGQGTEGFEHLGGHRVKCDDLSRSILRVDELKDADDVPVAILQRNIQHRHRTIAGTSIKVTGA